MLSSKHGAMDTYTTATVQTTAITAATAPTTVAIRLRPLLHHPPHPHPLPQQHVQLKQMVSEQMGTAAHTRIFPDTLHMLCRLSRLCVVSLMLCLFCVLLCMSLARFAVL